MYYWKYFTCIKSFNPYNKVKERLSNKAERRRDRKLQSLGLGRGESDL